ncbi:MAG TPA: serine/threonine-protein kinase [Polyangiaceae bacterium]|jgi:serine/threonine-protein kinase|nr:serine/threonine-protein kinase [Polyangiaceae bacterium]
MPVEIGEVLAGKYKVEDVLGVGGMGVVVAARHIQLEQKVALKFLRPEAMQSKEAVERFLREARNAVRLRSEHVAKVTDVGTLDSGAPYMVMEYLDGADLSRVVHATGSIAIEEAVYFVLQACEAIAEAHSLGIIHRDLKPQNLFVTRRVDGKPLVKVLDFGISKSIDAQGLSLTRTSSIMGSPLYMSPEQMRSSKNVDQRADIWALGVILYELLTGRVPFEAESVPELCLKVVQDEPTPPKGLRPEVPEGLSAVVLKCLEKNVTNRFSNVAELAASLEPYSAEIARGSSERIASTLNLPSRPPMVSISGIHSQSNPKIGTGGTAWGTTQALEAKKKRIPIFVGAGVAVLVVLTVGVGLAMKSSGKNDTQAAPTQPTQTAATATAATATATPTQTVTAPPTVWEPMTATATTTAQPTSTNVTRPRPGGSAKPLTGTASATTQKPAPTVTAPPKTFE